MDSRGSEGHHGVSPAARVLRPRGLAVARGWLYATADDLTRSVVRFNARLDGSGYRTNGRCGSGTGRFRAARGLAVSGSYPYVADTGNARVVRIGRKLDGSGVEGRVSLE
ncbi:MAG: hypothetical protein WCH74_10970 [Chloroflexota bacterium]